MEEARAPEGNPHKTETPQPDRGPQSTSGFEPSSCEAVPLFHEVASKKEPVKLEQSHPQTDAQPYNEMTCTYLTMARTKQSSLNLLPQGEINWKGPHCDFSGNFLGN